MHEESGGFRPVDRAKHEILVVDDDPVSRYTTVRWLHSAGFQTREAASGAEGLKLADASVSAMVLDVHLPDIDGFELCRMLRSRSLTERLPVLHLSAAYITEEDKVRGLDSGADAYLTHPVEPAVLVASVQALVRARVAEDAMRRSEEQFKAIYARVPSGICLLDAHGCLLDANPAMVQHLGRPLEALTGRSLAEFVPPEWVERADRFARGALASERGVEGRDSFDEFPVLTGAGNILALQWNMLPDIQPGVNMALATDVSERTALELQRQQALQSEREARSSAEKLNRMKDEFIAVLSHELRTPLTAIKAWVQILRKRDDGSQRERGLEAIERNVNVQARLVSDLLDLSSINLGKMRLTLGDVDVATVIEAVMAAFSGAIGTKELRVETALTAPYPTIRADASRLQQIISNLLGNAIKFSAHAGRIELAARAENEGVVISVVDQGQGISPEFLPRLFDRFSQADAGSNRRQGGLGLGLSIVRHLVESHDGRISVASAGAGLGSTFSVWLPSKGPATELRPT